MAETILTKSQHKVLEIITGTSLVEDFYLAGGTALALQLEHRYSDDFDFFCKDAFNADTILSVLQTHGKIKIRARDEGTLHLQMQGVKVSFLRYEYKLLSKLISKGNGLNLASIPDIAAMKVSAISNRGSKKDFIDLYTICTEHYPLKKTLTFFDRKYKPLESDYYHILSSLVYFDDAEPQKMPKMVTKTQWKEVKKYFEKEVSALNKK